MTKYAEDVDALTEGTSEAECSYSFGHNQHVVGRSFDRVLNLLGVLLWVAVCTRLGLWMLPPSRGHGLAGRNHRTFPYQKNPAAYLEYGRRIRTGFAYQVKGMTDQTKDLVTKFKAGEYKDHKDIFNADTVALSNALLDSIQQFDGQQVPDVLNGAHTKISLCHKFCYESIQALREAYESEGADQSRLVKEAEKKLKVAISTGNSGVKEFNLVWTRTRL